MAARQPPRATAEAPPLLSPAGGLGCLVPYSRALAPFPFGSFYIDSPTIRPPGVYPLPVELLTEIVGYVHEEAHLKTLCCVSRLFRDLAETQLYSDVWLYDRSAAESLQQTLSCHPTRQARIRRFSIDFCRRDRVRTHPINLLKPVLPEACLNLEELQVARNGKTIDDYRFVLELTRTLRLASFHRPSSQRILPSLTIVRLDLRPVSYDGATELEYDLEYSVLHIFFSPTLREIALRNAKFLRASYFLDMLNCEGFAQETPLKLLRLKDCRIDPIVIQQMLLLPRALETFHLDFFNNHWFHSQPHETIGDLDTWTQAFMQQTHALKEIAIIARPSPPLVRQSIPSAAKRLDLRAMQALSKVAGDFFIVFAHGLNMSDRINVISNDGYERSLAGTRTKWDALGDLKHAEDSDDFRLYDYDFHRYDYNFRPYDYDYHRYIDYIRRNPDRYYHDRFGLRCPPSRYQHWYHHNRLTDQRQEPDWPNVSWASGWPLHGP